ncbi:hypothetical protein ACVW1C_007270 [Bradyrhizobium sp. USDA 4011]
MRPKIAHKQIETYQEQEKATEQERALNGAKATAAAQTALTQLLRVTASKCAPLQRAGEGGLA